MNNHEREIAIFNPKMLERLQFGNSVLRSLRLIFELEYKISIRFKNVIKRMISDIEAGAMIHETMSDKKVFSAEYIEVARSYELDRRYYSTKYIELFEFLVANRVN